MVDSLGLLGGSVSVVTTSNGGRPPEYFAERIMQRLLHVSDQMPEPIKAQAFAYREQMAAIILAGIKAAIESDRNYRM